MNDGKFVLFHDFCFFVWCLKLLGGEGHTLVYRITSTVSACEVGDLLGLVMRLVMSGNETAKHYNGGSRVMALHASECVACRQRCGAR